MSAGRTEIDVRGGVRVLAFDGDRTVTRALTGESVAVGTPYEFRIGDPVTLRVGRVRLPPELTEQQAEAVSKAVNDALRWLGGGGLQP